MQAGALCAPGQQPALRIVSLGGGDCDRAPSFDIPLVELTCGGAPMPLDEARTLFADDPSRRSAPNPYSITLHCYSLPLNLNTGSGSSSHSIAYDFTCIFHTKQCPNNAGSHTLLALLACQLGSVRGGGAAGPHARGGRGWGRQPGSAHPLRRPLRWQPDRHARCSLPWLLA